MPDISKRLLRDVSREVRRTTGVRPFFMELNGGTDPETDPFTLTILKLKKLRIYALHESVTMGCPYFFEIMPGLGSWMVALEHRRIIHGALLGGEVLFKESPLSEADCTRTLLSWGLSEAQAHDYYVSRPVCSIQERNEAAACLERTFYQMSGWKAVQLEENRLRRQQQQQIAEAIEDQRQRGAETSYPFDKERILLSHIRSGDRTGARRVLNEMLGAMYLTTPKLVVLRARAIEMMGYLTRAAVEDSPILESLIERNHQWMERLIRARDFEALSRVLTDALNDFIEGIYVHGFNRSNAHVTRALDYITRNYMKPIRLKDIAREVGLSPYRLAHVVKEHSGKTLLQMIIHSRVQNAIQLLGNTNKSCTEIAYEVGFNDQSYFIRHFKRLTGITPARYRRTRLIPEPHPL
ncbi:MAG: AraC family transcriptional regulator [bacterium]